MTTQILAAFLSHGIFFRFPKISKNQPKPQEHQPAKNS